MSAFYSPKSPILKLLSERIGSGSQSKFARILLTTGIENVGTAREAELSTVHPRSNWAVLTVCVRRRDPCCNWPAFNWGLLAPPQCSIVEFYSLASLQLELENTLPRLQSIGLPISWNYGKDGEHCSHKSTILGDSGSKIRLFWVLSRQRCYDLMINRSSNWRASTQVNIRPHRVRSKHKNTSPEYYVLDFAFTDCVRRSHSQTLLYVDLE